MIRITQKWIVLGLNLCLSTSKFQASEYELYSDTVTILNFGVDTSKFAMFTSVSKQTENYILKHRAQEPSLNTLFQNVKRQKYINVQTWLVQMYNFSFFGTWIKRLIICWYFLKRIYWSKSLFNNVREKQGQKDWKTERPSMSKKSLSLLLLVWFS